MSDEKTKTEPGEANPGTITIRVKEQVRRVAGSRLCSLRVLLGLENIVVLTRLLPPQEGEETFFKVKPTTKMTKVFSAYAQRKGVKVTALRFMIDGNRIAENVRTPLWSKARPGDGL